MKVRLNQNSGIPAQSEANVVDGTSNTIMFGESAKAEKPFAKDKFELSKPSANSLCTNEIIVGGAVESPKDPFSGLKAQDDKGVEKPPAKKSFMDYTDDSGD